MADGFISPCKFPLAVPIARASARMGAASLRGIDLSDHRNYWQMGYKAVMITNTAFFRNDNYHQPTDTPDTLDYDRMAEVVKGVFWAILHL